MVTKELAVGFWEKFFGKIPSGEAQVGYHENRVLASEDAVGS